MTLEYSCDVLLLGNYFCDLIITGLGEIPHLGAEIFGNSMEIVPGGAYTSAVSLKRLGVNVHWAARFGNDLFSKFIFDEAKREGLDDSLFQQIPEPLRSLSISFSFAHDRGFISYQDPFPEQDTISIIEKQCPRWVVSAPFDSSSETRRLVDAVHASGGRVYADCQYVTTTLNESGLTDLLRVTDIFAPNQSEAKQLTGSSDPQAAAAILAEYCPMVIVKCGADGAYAQAGKKVWHSPALKVEVIDTTGAGDSFNAGFLAARLRGESIETCLRYGNICGGLSTTQRGGASAAPTLEHLKRYL